MKYVMFLLMFIPAISHAGAFTNKAIPIRVDIERGNGFMVYGSFGNAGACTKADMFYVEKGHPQYNEIYSSVLAAFMSGKKVTAYIHECNPVGWYSVRSTTYNTLTPAGALNLEN